MPKNGQMCHFWESHFESIPKVGVHCEKIYIGNLNEQIKILRIFEQNMEKRNEERKKKQNPPCDPDCDPLCLIVHRNG